MLTSPKPEPATLNAMKGGPNMRLPRSAALAIALVSAGLAVSVPTNATAQSAIPDRLTWTLHDGTVIRAKAYDFGYQQYLLQRRHGKLFLNGNRLEDVTADPLLVKLAEVYEVPLTIPAQLQKVLVAQPNATLVLPFPTLKFDGIQGRGSEVATILLAPEDIQLLRPAYDAWREAQRQKFEAGQEKLAERARQEQELRNQEQMLFMQAMQLQAQIETARAAWAQAAATEQVAYALQEQNLVQQYSAMQSRAQAAAAKRTAYANERQADAQEVMAMAALLQALERRPVYGYGGGVSR